MKYNLIMKKTLYKNIFSLTSFLILTSCTNNNAVTSPVVKDNAQIQSVKQTINPDFDLLIEQKKTNGEIISIGSKGIESVSIDGYDYPINKLTKNQLRVDIPQVAPGKHQLKVSVYLAKEPFILPLIIPDLSQKIYVLLRVTTNEATKELMKIEYGYDLDQNGIIDLNNDRFESSGKDFFQISSNGTKKKIDITLSTGKTLPNESVPPPGVVPSADPQSQKNDTSHPQIQIPDPPKPKTNDNDLYPLPPNNKINDPVPVPINVPKSVPPDDQIPTPAPIEN